MNAEKVIRVRMAVQGISTVTDLAKQSGMVRQTLSYKLKNPGTFTAFELNALQGILKLTNDDLATIIKGEK